MSYLSNTGVVLFLAFALFSCSAYNSGQGTLSNQDADQSVSGRFALPQSVAPPADIQSVYLHPTGDATAPPIITLGQNSLTLQFDYLGSGGRQFTISISHRDRKWQESPIGPNVYMGSFFETSFAGRKQSFVQGPSYLHYQYTFPNERISITKSGNYLLSISDYRTNELLFRIPFFVTEDTGMLNTRIESLFTQRDDGRTVAQPFSVFKYPNFVQQPRFDLSFFYVQNRFWDRARQTSLFDTATPGEVHFHLDRERSFLSDYEFNVLDLSTFDADGRQIIEYQPTNTPPTVTLRRDLQQFNQIVSPYPAPVLGIPRDDRQARYAEIEFSLETTASIQPSDQIYLVGDFNNWMIEPTYRMQYDSTARLWRGDALVKQGIYAYKYVRLESGSINDLALDQSFTNRRQEYLTLVYYRDPQRQFDRLLKVDRLIK